MDLAFDTDGLYILLLDRGHAWTFHWGFYLARSATEGTFYHVFNPPKSTEWMYETKHSSNILNSNRLLLALRVGLIEPMLQEMTGECLSQIPIEYSLRYHEDMTCRVWVKEALYELNERGLINIIKTVNAIENEAKAHAMFQKVQNKKSIKKCTGTHE